MSQDKAERRWTIWVCPPKWGEDGLWSSERTGPWRTLAAYRNLDAPEPVEVMPVAEHRQEVEALRERLRAEQASHEITRGIRAEAESAIATAIKELEKQAEQADADGQSGNAGGLEGIHLSTRAQTLRGAAALLRQNRDKGGEDGGR